jgi:hypothetical protein
MPVKLSEFILCFSVLNLRSQLWSGNATDAPPPQNDVGEPDGQTEPLANDEEGNTDTAKG